MKPGLVVMISGSGSNLQALIDAQQQQQLAGEIVAVVSDNAQAAGNQRTLAANIPLLCLPYRRGADREQWASLISGLIAPFQPQLLIMAGWMRIMPASFVERWAPNLINQHPALLPDGAADSYTLRDGRVIPAIRGAHAVRDALKLGLPVTGCTIHQVTAHVDIGPVLARVEVPVEPHDNLETLQERIKHQEHRLIVEVVNRLVHKEHS